MNPMFFACSATFVHAVSVANLCGPFPVGAAILRSSASFVTQSRSCDVCTPMSAKTKRGVD